MEETRVIIEPKQGCGLVVIDNVTGDNIGVITWRNYSDITENIKKMLSDFFDYNEEEVFISEFYGDHVEEKLFIINVTLGDDDYTQLIKLKHIWLY